MGTIDAVSDIQETYLLRQPKVRDRTQIEIIH